MSDSKQPEDALWVKYGGDWHKYEQPEEHEPEAIQLRQNLKPSGQTSPSQHAGKRALAKTPKTPELPDIVVEISANEAEVAAVGPSWKHVSAVEEQAFWDRKATTLLHAKVKGIKRGSEAIHLSAWGMPYAK